MNTTAISEDFKKILTDGEEIIWQGTPEKITFFTRADILLLPLTLLLGGYLIFWSIASARLIAAGNLSFPLFGLLFLLIGIYLVFGRIWFRYKRRSRDCYAVTSKRVITVNSLRDTSTEFIPLSELTPRISGKNLLLGEQNFWGDIFCGLGLDLFFPSAAHETFGFYGISQPETILNIIDKYKNRERA